LSYFRFPFPLCVDSWMHSWRSIFHCGWQYSFRKWKSIPRCGSWYALWLKRLNLILNKCFFELMKHQCFVICTPARKPSFATFQLEMDSSSFDMPRMSIVHLFIFSK
jgi:hypothetical protein